MLCADVWGVQLLCLEFMRSVMGVSHPCLLLEFPVPFCGIHSLPCTTTSQILEVGPVGDACRTCRCHNAPVQGPPEAGEIHEQLPKKTGGPLYPLEAPHEG